MMRAVVVPLWEVHASRVPWLQRWDSGAHRVMPLMILRDGQQVAALQEALEKERERCDRALERVEAQGRELRAAEQAASRAQRAGNPEDQMVAEVREVYPLRPAEKRTLCLAEIQAERRPARGGAGA